MTKMLHDAWVTLKHLWAVVPIGISIAALYVSLHDRRPRLTLRERKGSWCVLRQIAGGELAFEGVIEVYNSSARSNAIRDYKFWCRNAQEGTWESMESEPYYLMINTDPEGQTNVTPFTIAPYSGIELRVMAFTKMPIAEALNVRVETEDLFGKCYQIEVTARRGQSN